MNNEIFAEIQLKDFRTASVIQCKGKHFFKILGVSNFGAGNMLRMSLLQLVLVNGKPIKKRTLDNLYPEDILTLSEIVNAMIGNNGLIKQFK